MVINLIKYPNNIRKDITKYNNHANRGMTLESEINDTNRYYLDNDIAVIYKKPTPIKVVEQVNNKITSAFFLEPSTTDYNGIYMSHYVDFEAKETKNKSSFPLNNIHRHQIDHIRRIYKENGICFLIIRFTLLDETYLLFAKDFLEFVDNNSRKSIPILYIRDRGYIIRNKIRPSVDYIEIIKEYGGILNGKEK